LRKLATLGAARHANGLAGSEATLTGTAVGVEPEWMKSVPIGALVMIRGQSKESEENGLYMMQRHADASSPWMLTTWLRPKGDARIAMPGPQEPLPCVFHRYPVMAAEKSSAEVLLEMEQIVEMMDHAPASVEKLRG
jgi:hypothetical protein